MIAAIEQMEDEKKALEERMSDIYLSAEDISAFGDLVGDYNDIHRNTEAAKAMKFDDTPVIGVHLAALGGKFSRDLLEIIKRNNPDMRFVGQKTTFKKPIYRDQTQRWSLEGLSYDPNGLTAIISVERDGEKKLEVESRYSTFPPVPETKNEDDLIFREETIIEPEEVMEFYRRIREDPRETVAYAHGTAMIPTALLNFVGELNKMFGRNVNGMNNQMDSQFYEVINPGQVAIDVYQKSERANDRRGLYVFDGVLSQDGRPKIQTQITCLTTGRLDTRALRPKLGYAA